MLLIRKKVSRFPKSPSSMYANSRNPKFHDNFGYNSFSFFLTFLAKKTVEGHLLMKHL